MSETMGHPGFDEKGNSTFRGIRLAWKMEFLRFPYQREGEPAMFRSARRHNRFYVLSRYSSNPGGYSLAPRRQGSLSIPETVCGGSINPPFEKQES